MLLAIQSTAPSPLPGSTPVIILQVMPLILAFFVSLLKELARRFALSFGVDIVKPQARECVVTLHRLAKLS